MPSALVRSLVPAAVPDQDPMQGVERIYEVAIGMQARKGKESEDDGGSDNGKENGHGKPDKGMPLHFVLGQDALTLVRAKLDRLGDEIEDWAGLSQNLGV
jgi:hypothetical protein